MGEPGYALALRFWGLGYGAEAAVARFAFEEAGLPALFAATGETNFASQRVIAKIGVAPLPERIYYPQCPNFILTRQAYCARRADPSNSPL